MGERVQQPPFTRDDSGRGQSSTLRQVLATVLALVVFGVLLPIAAPGLTVANAAAVADPTELDAVRLDTIGELVAAFEAHALTSGGRNNSGWGSVYPNRANSSSYGSRSIAEALNDAGAAVATEPTSPLRLWEVAAQPCNGRMAIFSGSDNLVADPADAQWWSDHDCNAWYLTNGRPYFQLTELEASPTTLDDVRVATVAELVAAFDEYLLAEGAYPATGGFRNEGGGSVYVNNAKNSNYASRSVTETLTDAGVAVATSPTAPLTSIWEIAARTCGGRVGIFSGSDNLTTDPADAQWWTDNDCPTWYLSNGRPYFQLTDPVRPVTVDDIREAMVTDLVTAFESYAVVHGGYTITGGSRDRGWGSVHVNRDTSASYGTKSVTQALNAAYISVPTAPRAPLTSIWEIAARPCNGRVGIFSGSDNLTIDPADEQWWADNDCPTWYLSNGRPYFQLTGAVNTIPPRVNIAQFGGLVRIEVLTSATGLPMVDGYRLYDEANELVDDLPEEEGSALFLVDPALLTEGRSYSVVSYIGDQVSDPTPVTIPVSMSETVEVDYTDDDVVKIVVPASDAPIERYQLVDRHLEEVDAADNNLNNPATVVLELSRSDLAYDTTYIYNVVALIGAAESTPRAVRVFVADPNAPDGPRVTQSMVQDHVYIHASRSSTGLATAEGYKLYNELGFEIASRPEEEGYAAFFVDSEAIALDTELTYTVRSFDGARLSKPTSVTFTGPAVRPGPRIQAGAGVTKCHGQPVTVQLSLGEQPTAGNDVILGTAGDDVIDALGGDDVVCGLGGDDTLRGGSGTDALLGGDGNDTLSGGAGNDYLHGENDDDTLSGDADDDTLHGGAGADTAHGNDGNDQLYGHDGADHLYGGAGDDFVEGGSGDDVMHGSAFRQRVPNDQWIDTDPGADTMAGREGDDRIWGGPGDDVLHGNEGNDWMAGGAGADILFGHDGTDQLGGGVDEYFYEGGVLKGRADRFNQDEMNPGPGGPTVGGAPLVSDGGVRERAAAPDEVFIFLSDERLREMAQEREDAGNQGVFLDCWGVY